MDKLYSLANEVERLLQFVDANKTDNPGEARFIIRRLREKIAETRESQDSVKCATCGKPMEDKGAATQWCSDECCRKQHKHTLPKDGLGGIANFLPPLDDLSTQNPDLNCDGCGESLAKPNGNGILTIGFPGQEKRYHKDCIENPITVKRR